VVEEETKNEDVRCVGWLIQQQVTWDVEIFSAPALKTLQNTLASSMIDSCSLLITSCAQSALFCSYMLGPMAFISEYPREVTLAIFSADDRLTSAIF
jgi:hypothetical protein